MNLSCCWRQSISAATSLSSSTLRNLHRCVRRFQHEQAHSTIVNSHPTSSISPQRPISQPTHFTHTDLLAPSDVTPGISRAEYVDRRRRLSAALPPDSLTVFLPNGQYYMSEDVPYQYHPNTDLYYACGIQEPDAILFAYRQSSSQAKYTLCVQPRDPQRELWDGPRCGPTSEISSYFGLDNIIALSEAPTFIVDHLPQLSSLHLDICTNPNLAHTLLSQVSRVKGKIADERRLKLESVWRRDVAPKRFLQPLRLRKSKAEINLMRKAARATSLALNSAMAAKDLREACIDARISLESIHHGGTRMAFPSVVASGINATVLHYMRKDTTARPGDMVMVDTGCEVHGYCSDVSRSWPIATKFSAPQRDLYSLVLEAHEGCVKKAIAGQSVDGLHTIAAQVLTDGLLHLGFLKGHSRESALTTGAYSKYFPHAIGHYLGLDIHDTHAVHKSLALERDMVITVEPGLYCHVDDDEAPEHFRGIGMRFEDDVVVGDALTAPEVLSKDAVREIDDIENLTS